MTDRLESRSALRVAAVVLAAALGAGCQPLDPAQGAPAPSGPPVPCTREVAVASDTVVITAAACNPYCLHVAAGTPVYFLNHDGTAYYFVASPALPYDLPVPAYAGTVTLPLAAGTVTWTAVHAPSATATVFVE